MKRFFHKRTVVIAFVTIGFCLNIFASTSRQPLINVYTKADFTNSLGMGFNKIPAGKFMMGSPKDEPGRRDNETLHQVTLTKSYYIQTTPVTQGQWKAVMGDKPSKYKDCGYDCPVECVTPYDIADFIEKLNTLGEGTYRLPTEAEWEYAARAGTTTPYSSGDRLPKKEDKVNIPVASFKSNAWGLYDMHGSVAQLVQDKYGGDYPSDAVTDPTEAVSDPDISMYSLPIYRGGRSAARYEYRFSHYGLLCGNAGFRLVLEQLPQKSLEGKFSRQ